ncbi:MAG TPA: hypothetical protein VFK41_00530 [Nocardioidaceae bacterium]|nr:hypothetical protein [Nocardioidaceae bacterium]
MAGGGIGRRGGISLEQRVRGTAGQRGEPIDDCPARHCWVADAADRAGVKRPGLLVEWRSVTGRWEGRVVYLARLRSDSWQVVEEWVPEELLTPR